jgi:hypothetical protein
MEAITSKQLARLVVNKAKQDESDWNVLTELVAENKRSYALQQGPAGSDPEGLNIDEYAPITSPRTWGIVRFYLIRSHAIHGEGLPDYHLVKTLAGACVRRSGSYEELMMFLIGWVSDRIAGEILRDPAGIAEADHPNEVIVHSDQHAERERPDDMYVSNGEPPLPASWETPFRAVQREMTPGGQRKNLERLSRKVRAQIVQGRSQT